MGYRNRMRNKIVSVDVINRYAVKDPKTFPELYKRKEYFPPVRKKEEELEDDAA